MCMAESLCYSPETITTFLLYPNTNNIEYEMVGWHHQLDGHEFEQTLGVGDG